MKRLPVFLGYAGAAAKGVGAVALALLCMVLYMGLGTLIMIPYCLMAGDTIPIIFNDGFDNGGAPPAMIFFAPVVVAMLVIANIIGSAMKYGSEEYHPQSDGFFWAIFAYVCTPIWVAALSGVAAMLGWEKIAGALFAVRYESFILVPIILIVGCIMYWKSMDAWHGWGFVGGGDPPEQTPDSQAETRESNAKLNEDGNSMQRMLQIVTP